MDAPRRHGRVQAAPPPVVAVKRSPRRFLRSSVLMLFGAALLCVFVTLNRDKNIERHFLASTSERAGQIRAHWARAHALPVELEDLSGSARRAPLESYADADTRFYAMRAEGPVMIGYTPMAPMVATYNGRAVILFDQGKVTTKWVNEGEFKRIQRRQDAEVAAMLERIRSRPPELPE